MINLDANKFRNFGFGEAEIWPISPHPNNNSLELLVWGADASALFLETLGLEVQHNSNYYLQGWTTFKFKKLTNLQVRVSLYGDKKGSRFLKNDNSNLKLEKEFIHNNDCSTHAYANYYISCVMTWPFGFCEIELNGSNEFEVDLTGVSLIALNDYLQDISRYNSKS